MNTPLDTKGERNRRKIVEAANLLFYQKGYSRTSFTDVATMSEIPKGNFYFYFKSKDQLLTAVIDSKFSFIKAKLQEYEQGYPTAIERLKRLASMPLTESGNIIRYGCPIGSLTTELAKSRKEETVETQKLFDLYINWATRQFKALNTRDNPDQLAQHMIARMQGIITLANIYADAELLEREIALLKKWLDEFKPEETA